MHQANYFIFVASPISLETGIIPSLKVAAGRLRKGYWPLGEKTSNRKFLAPGDKALVYAGKVKLFVASTEIFSNVMHTPFAARKSLEYEYDYLLGAPFGIKLSNSTLFRSPVRADIVTARLSFVKNQQFWWTYFQHGVIRIGEKDFWVVIEHSLENSSPEDASFAS